MNKENIFWRVSSFTDLNTQELYEILDARLRVFVEEQCILYVDTDFADQKAYHLCGYGGDLLTAYCRIFDKGYKYDNVSIGRVLVDKAYRKFGLGHELMKQAIRFVEKELGETSITISAQSYLQRFYEVHGFVVEREEYMEEGVPHIQMTRK